MSSLGNQKAVDEECILIEAVVQEKSPSISEPKEGLATQARKLASSDFHLVNLIKLVFFLTSNSSSAVSIFSSRQKGERPSMYNRIINGSFG